MAKRTRGSNRPGQRHGSARPITRPAARPDSALSEAEEARAAELESEIVAQERVVDTAKNRARDRARAADATRPGRPGGQGLLAVKAAEEYAYVVRDVRRILLVGSVLVLALVVAFVLIDVTHVISIT
jgi:hypothetical protein